MSIDDIKIGSATDAANVFKTLRAISVEKQQKGQFNYASWSSVWDEIKNKYSCASFKVHENDEGLPFFKHGNEAMCKVTVMVKGLMHTSWLPVLNFSNKPIENPNVFEINTTIQRCFVKACALHGLGLHIYKGEDLPKIVDVKV